MNTSSETNINIRLNPVNKDTKFRILYAAPENGGHRKYIAQFKNTLNENWETLRYYKADTEEVKPAYFNNTRKASRFLRKIFIANDFEIPEEFQSYDELRDQRYEIWMGNKKVEDVLGDEHFENRWNNLIKSYQDREYKILEDSSRGYCILVSYLLKSCVFLSYRHNLGFTDYKGQTIYEGDILHEDKPGGWEVFLHKNDDNTWKMILSEYACGNHREIDNITQSTINNMKIAVGKPNHLMFG